MIRSLCTSGPWKLGGNILKNCIGNLYESSCGWLYLRFLRIRDSIYTELACETQSLHSQGLNKART